MILLNAKDEQFSLGEDGSVLFQEKYGSPLPGQPVGVIRKGVDILKPALELSEENEEVRTRLQSWLDAHISSVLEPLVLLDQHEADVPEPVRGIAAKVRDALGILPREDLQDLIDQLDADSRGFVRAKKIRLGPILVFIPALNKPAAVRLRAKLWALYHEKPLPVEVPADGIVSCKVDVEAVDQDFYRSIGYPVYGPRAVRIDMLDRVIVSVYDLADKGKFQAQHQMAEWLGAPIEDLYEILEAMGHKKIHDPADEAEAVKGEGEQDAIVTEPEKVESESEKAPDDVVEGEQKPQKQKKPELATFRLKRGRANEKEERREKAGGKAPHRSGSSDEGRKSGKKKNKNPKGKAYKQSMMSAGPKTTKPEDSPFAILEQLKNK